MGIGVGAGIGMGLNAIGVNEIGVKLEGNVTGTEEGMGVNWGGVDGGGGAAAGAMGGGLAAAGGAAQASFFFCVSHTRWMSQCWY